MTENGEPAFRVILSGDKVAEEAKQLTRLADDLGIRESFVSALADIHERLRRDPLNFGEYCFSLKEIELLSYVVAIRPAAVRYFVKRQPPIVLVTKIILMGS